MWNVNLINRSYCNSFIEEPYIHHTNTRFFKKTQFSSNYIDYWEVSRTTHSPIITN